MRLIVNVKIICLIYLQIKYEFFVFRLKKATGHDVSTVSSLSLWALQIYYPCCSWYFGGGVEMSRRPVSTKNKNNNNNNKGKYKGEKRPENILRCVCVSRDF